MKIESFKKEQIVCEIAGVKIGGQPGVNPTALAGSMFHKGDRLIKDRKAGEFDKEAARDHINQLEEISSQIGIPALIDIVANSGPEFAAYLEFVSTETSMPICVDAWQPNVRVDAAKEAERLGLLDRLIYNSLNPWNPEIESEVKEISEIGVRHVLVAVFDDADKMASGRITALEKLLPAIEKGGFESLLVDTTVMNVAATAFSIQAGFEIKERFGLPVGCAPSNGTYMWKEFRDAASRAGFAGADAAAHGIASLLWNDFMFYGPMTGTERVFAATAVAESIKAMFAYAESGDLPDDKAHLVRKFFPKFLEQLDSEND